ncbi:CCA tRNA nucleotidyltransferase [Methylobacterium brachythecii]|uniref:Poly(A) polymerase n=1 Tax=Methylobacterium brachythecii TaxID=1176177 RepID=A0A7W6AE98_9HYPH|nr:CCA tRNA nucleotidyltransferase [Methylobacterium brachythecii]MBB3901093.1 tRNA nucleotidyltransferase/poly(A) polymerase [Methylobacterium brachythecii]GLS45207.1 poly(A) polymerase [Methylobacterium brachythecii]
MIPAGLDPDGPKRLLERPGVATCLAALAAEGEETRLVGGCVRDALLGRDAADIDFATTHPPAGTLTLAKTAGLKAVPTGFEHGTVTLVVDGAPFEVTTLREDIETDGRHAVVRFGRDFARDAERRDFTINALSLGADGHLHDPGDGLRDLAEGRVRFIGDPATRIREDALRSLRFFRFDARFGRGAPDRPALDAIVAARASLDRLSRERIRAELLKLLLAERAVPAVAVMSETGLLARLLGGVIDLGRLARASADPASPAIARLAALAVQTVEDAERLREVLRLSKAEHTHLVAYAKALAALRGQAQIEAQAMRGLAATYGPDMVAEVLRAIEGEPRPRVEAEALAVLSGLVAARDTPVLPLGGADLVARGVPAGRAIGRGLAAARALWLSEGCPMDEAARERLIAHALTAAERDD